MVDPSWQAQAIAELQHIRRLLEQLVEQGEERRAGERQLEELGAMLAGGDSHVEELSDAQLIDAFYYMVDGTYGIRLPHEGSRAATEEETQRLQQLTGRRRKKG